MDEDLNVHGLVKLLSDRLALMRSTQTADMETITDLVFVAAYLTAVLAAPMFAAAKESGGDPSEGIEALLGDLRRLLHEKTNEAHTVMHSMQAAQKFIEKLGGVH